MPFLLRCLWSLDGTAVGHRDRLPRLAVHHVGQRIAVRLEHGRQLLVAVHRPKVRIVRRPVRPFHEMIALFGCGSEGNLLAPDIRATARHASACRSLKDNVVSSFLQYKRFAGIPLERPFGKRKHRGNLHLLLCRPVIALESHLLAFRHIAADSHIIIGDLFARNGLHRGHPAAFVAAESCHLIIAGHHRPVRAMQLERAIHRHVILPGIHVATPPGLLGLHQARHPEDAGQPTYYSQFVHNRLV